MTLRYEYTAWAAMGLAMSLPSHAIAQQAVSPQVDDRVYADIVVTAQRREQNLQDVPLAVSALSADTIEGLGIKTTSDLALAAPGLTIAPSVNAISPFIRGVGNTNTSPGEESATAIYVDGVYISTLTSAMFSLANIERVEVLRGPQGTLFGRNAVAGVIQIITRKPSTTPSMDLAVGYGNYGTFDASLYATAGLADDLAADLSVYFSHQNDGWGTNLTTGNDIFKGREFGVRTRWVWDIGDSTELSFGADYNRSRPVVTQAYTQRPGSVLSTGQVSPGFYNARLSEDVTALTKQWGGNVQLRHDFGGLQLVGISSYRKVESDFVFDQDGQSVNLGFFSFNRGAKTFTQEVQLLAPAGSAIDWIIGAFYYHDDSFSRPTQLQGALFGPLTIRRFATQKARSYAAFGQATAELLADTNLTVGLRYTIDRRSIVGEDRNLLAGNPLPVSNIVDNRETFRRPTWRISLDHKFADHVLGYVSYNRGFKSGVYNVANQTLPIVKPATVDAFEFGLKTEPLHRMRLNISTFYNDYKNIQFNVSTPTGQALLNAAAGRIFGAEAELDWRATSNLSINGGLSLQDSKYKSFDNAPAFTPLPGGGNVESIVDAAGKKMVQAPDFTAYVSARYVIPTSAGDFTLIGSYNYNDGFYFEPQNRIGQPAHHLFNASVEWQPIDGMFGLRFWGRNLAGEKYFSTAQPSAFGDLMVPAAPRTYGITATAHF